MVAIAKPFRIHRNTLIGDRIKSIHSARTTGPVRCRKKFLHFFPRGFQDPTYLAWERDYKFRAHARWQEDLNAGGLGDLIKRERFQEIASRAVRIESRTNPLFSFEKMALRDAVRTRSGDRVFAEALWRYLEGPVDRAGFEEWIRQLAAKAVIAKHVHAHGLRHTHAAQLREEGFDIGIVAKQLGHRSILTTIRYLDHVQPTAVIDAVRSRARGG